MTIYDPDGLEFCPSRCPRRRHLDYIFNGEPFTPMGTDDKFLQLRADNFTCRLWFGRQTVEEGTSVSTSMEREA